MNKIVFLFLSLVLTVLLACNSSKKIVSATSKKTAVSAKDSVEYYEEIVDARQGDFSKALKGSWEIITMSRQQKAPIEKLQNVEINFTDSTVSGKAPCNRYTGSYTTKGTGIKFGNIASTMMYCDNKMNEEDAFFMLLRTRISAFTVNGDTLYLRDGASNIVFEAKKK